MVVQVQTADVKRVISYLGDEKSDSLEITRKHQKIFNKSLFTSFISTSAPNPHLMMQKSKLF